MTPLPAEKVTWGTTCKECGMRLHDSFEYHPYAACLMFRACGDRATVLANLNAVLKHAAPDETFGHSCEGCDGTGGPNKTCAGCGGTGFQSTRTAE